VLEHDLDKSVGYWIHVTKMTIRRVLTERLAEEGITLRQWEVLAALALDPEQTQVRMADKMGIEAPTLAGIVNRMERDGWLERQTDADDRRRRKLIPTPKAEEIWQRASALCHDIRRQAVKSLSDAELDDLKRMCQQIQANLSSPELASEEETAAGEVSGDDL